MTEPAVKQIATRLSIPDVQTSAEPTEKGGDRWTILKIPRTEVELQLDDDQQGVAF